MSQNPLENVVEVASHTLFASLAAAKKSGWIVRTRNQGPQDWKHYSATIFHKDDPLFSEFLMSENSDWQRSEAKSHALAWINNHVANSGL